MSWPPVRNTAQELGPLAFDWWLDWRGKTAAIIASGPSAANAGVEQLRGRVPVMAVNESHQLAPWADALYGCDGKWWKLRAFVPSFKGLKLTFDAGTSVHRPEIKRIDVATHSDDVLVERPGRIGSGGNSGFQALNLAVQFGAKRILLVGYDMRVDFGEHWHGRHPPGLNNPCPVGNLPRWIKAFEGSAGVLAALGVNVINCSPVSALANYPKSTITRALSA